METYKVDQTKLNELKELVDNNIQEVQNMYPDEFNLCSNRLDHIEMQATQITFYDRGCDFGDGVIDNTFRIISK